MAQVTEKLCGNRLSWYGHVLRRNEENVVRRVLSMNIDGYMSRGRPKKRWMECVNADMVIEGVTTEMTTNREVW